MFPESTIPAGDILVVDCDQRELTSTVSMLRSEGYVASGAATFEAARKMIRAHRHDLLITALRLLPYNGLHLVIHNQALYPQTRAIVLASSADVGIDIEAERLGAHCVRTPVEPERLLTMIRLVLEGRPVRSRFHRRIQPAH